MASSRRQYPFHLIEPKWQQTWDQQQAFRAFNPGEAVPANHPFAERHGLAGQTPDAAKLPPKFYILDMFPYPSGAGLHVGHPEGYTATDILARYRRACGFNVLHPMGWDAFGLPAEQYAIKTGQHPRKTTEANIANFTRQIKSLGFSYDWTREVDTTDPGYFKWTQWIFLKLYNSYFDPEWNKATPIALLEDALSNPPKQKHSWQLNSYLDGMHQGYLKIEGETPAVRDGARRNIIDRHRLAYVSKAPVNWCPELGTVLANEEVIDGKSEVGGFPVVRRPMRQWMLRITAYAEKLLADLETIDWSDSLKEMQRNWIGRSEGAEVDFAIADCRLPIADSKIRVFTTRPDTLFGATYMVLAPEHKLVDRIVAGHWPPRCPDAWKGVLDIPNPDGNAASAGVKLQKGHCATPEEAVASYRACAAGKSDLERTELAKEKTGVFTGAYAINPVNGQKIPIWIADYVLASYGTGAIMAVPAHDTRDFEFATKFNLPIVQVVQPPDPKTDWRGFVDDGTSVNSTGPEISITGLPTPEAKKKITEWLEAKGLGKKTVNFKLRDWLFSRQRYWGEPFPIIWKKDAAGNLHHEALPESALPLLPPQLDDYKPTSDGQPPLARAKDWLTLPDGSTRETNTMPQWAGSCWYYLRYLDARNGDAFVGKEAEQYWMAAEAGRAGSACGASERPAPHADHAVHAPHAPTPGVDLYVGGTEHAVLHLLYARFWHKVLFDLGCVSTPEPFFKLVNQGLILGEMEYYAFKDKQGGWVSSREVVDIVEIAGSLAGKANSVEGETVTAIKVKEIDVEKDGPWFYLKAEVTHLRIRVEGRCSKMSKSRGNVVNPDDILTEFGADAFRLYEMFMGPLEMVKPWNTKGVEGVHRFLGRVWRMFVDEQSETEFEQAETTTEAQRHGELLGLIKLSPAIEDAQPSPAQLKTLHTCIKKVTEDLDGMRFNTAISAMMVFTNDAIAWEVKPVAVLRDFLILLQPFAPHVAEELWSKLSTLNSQLSTCLAYFPWPKFDPALLVEDTLEIPVQVNGKLRDVIKVPANADNAAVEAAAKASEKAQQFMAGKTIKKVIVVPKKLVNIVAV